MGAFSERMACVRAGPDSFFRTESRQPVRPTRVRLPIYFFIELLKRGRDGNIIINITSFLLIRLLHFLD